MVEFSMFYAKIEEKEMTYERAMLIIICILIGLTVLFSITGCGLLQRTSDWIFVPSDKVEETPETSKDALWQTVKKAKDNLFTSMAIPIIALGAAVIYLGFRKLGMACVIFGAVNLIMALASAKFAFWMALFGFIGTALALAASILAKNRAVKELVYGAQAVKDYAVEQLKGNREGFNRILDGTQKTKSTQKFVKRIKDKAKLKEMKLIGDA